jgi:hypothetical protein
VPSAPVLSGATAYLQAASVDTSLPGWFELTNALAVVLGP